MLKLCRSDKLQLVQSFQIKKIDLAHKTRSISLLFFFFLGWTLLVATTTGTTAATTFSFGNTPDFPEYEAERHSTDQHNTNTHNFSPLLKPESPTTLINCKGDKPSKDCRVNHCNNWPFERLGFSLDYPNYCQTRTI